MKQTFPTACPYLKLLPLDPLTTPESLYKLFSYALHTSAAYVKCFISRLFYQIFYLYMTLVEMTRVAQMFRAVLPVGTP
jgi:hypothetical protein